MIVPEVAAAAAVFCHYHASLSGTGVLNTDFTSQSLRVRNHDAARTAYTEESLTLGARPGIYLVTTPHTSNMQSSPELLACRDRSSCDQHMVRKRLDPGWQLECCDFPVAHGHLGKTPKNLFPEHRVLDSASESLWTRKIIKDTKGIYVGFIY